MKIAISTVVTEKYLKEFELLHFSSKKTGLDLEWHIVCNKESESAVKALEPKARLVVKDFAEGEQWGSQESQSAFDQAIRYKFDAASNALKTGLPVLMVDCDIFFVNEFDQETLKNMRDESLECVVCPHMQQAPQIDNQWGFFNVGFVFVRSEKFLEKWREVTESGQYKYEQKPMEKVLFDENVVYELFPFTYNFSWWRFNQKTTAPRVNDIMLFNGSMRYMGSNVVSIHTHILDDSDYPQCSQFNTLMKNFMKGSYENKDVLNKINELSEPNQ
jgi:lipopolysaccharide biosynthesis glycosyltransferase